MATITVDDAAPGTRRAPRRTNPGRKIRRRNTAIGWTFILPNFVGFALLTLIPVLVLFLRPARKKAPGGLSVTEEDRVVPNRKSAKRGKASSAKKKKARSARGRGS